jgi:hypothetical protein
VEPFAPETFLTGALITIMSDFNFEGVVPLTGPVTPGVVFPVVPIGPLVPGASAACEIAKENKEYVTIKATIDR